MSEFGIGPFVKVPRRLLKIVLDAIMEQGTAFETRWSSRDGSVISVWFFDLDEARYWRERVMELCDAEEMLERSNVRNSEQC